MSDYDSKAIEDKAVNEVIRYFEDSKVVATYLANNDKEPFFDGNLYLYQGGERDNTHYIGRVAVQVKGKDLVKFKKGVFSYPIEMTDLKAYLHEGIAFFVVQEVKRKKRFFYRLLTPVELRSIIMNKPENGTVSVRLNRATDRDIKKVESELIEFERNCRKQVSFVDTKPLDFEDLQKRGIHSFSVEVTAKSTKGPFYALTSTPVFLYANLGEGIQVPIGEGPANLSFSQVVDDMVSVKGEVFFKSFKMTIDRGLLTINVSECFSLSYDPNDLKKKANFLFKRGAKKLKDAINEASFLLALQINKEVTIGKITIPIPFPDNHQISEGLDKQLKVWRSLDETFKMLGCNKDLDLSLLKDSDGSTIEILISMIRDSCSLSLNNVTPGINIVELANMRLWLLIYKGDDDKHIMKNFFDKSLGMTVSYRYPEGVLGESIYSWFDRKKLIDCDNFPYDDVVGSYEELKNVNPHAYERENLFLLELIAAYDKTDDNEKKKLMFDAAYDISQWLIVHDDEHIIQNQLNKFQLIKRGSGLSDDDEKELKRLQLENTSNVEISYAISLLLDDKASYEYYWGKMDQKIRNIYKKRMPIYIFHA